MNTEKTPDRIEIESTLIRKISPECPALSEKVTFVSGEKARVVTECLNTHETVTRETELPPGLFQVVKALIDTLSPMDGDFSGGTWVITERLGDEVIKTFKGPVTIDRTLCAFSRTFRDLLGLKALIALDGEISQSELSSFTITYDDDDENSEKAIFEAGKMELRLYQKSGDDKESYVQLKLAPWQVAVIRDSVETDLFLRQAKPAERKGFARISFVLNFADGSAITHSSDLLVNVIPGGYIRLLDMIATAVSDASFMFMFSRAVMVRSKDDFLFVKAVFDGSSKKYTYMIRDMRVWEDSAVLVPAGNEVATVKVTDVIAAPVDDPPYPVSRLRVAFGLPGMVSFRSAPQCSAEAALRHLANLSSMRNETPFIPDVFSKAIALLMATDLMVYVPTEPGVMEDNYFLLSGDGLELLPCFLSEEDDRMDVIAGHVLMSFHDYALTIRDHRDFTGGAIDPFGCPIMLNRILVEDAFSAVTTTSFYRIKGELNTDLYIMIKGKKVVKACGKRLGITLSEGFTEAGGRLFLVVEEHDALNGKVFFALVHEAVRRGVMSLTVFEKDSGGALTGMLSCFSSYYREVYLDVFIREK